jgi:3',5'-cyclic AMP phosphodiesterase CpdA
MGLGTADIKPDHIVLTGDYSNYGSMSVMAILQQLTTLQRAFEEVINKSNQPPCRQSGKSEVFQFLIVDSAHRW